MFGFDFTLSRPPVQTLEAVPLKGAVNYASIPIAFSRSTRGGNNNK